MSWGWVNEQRHPILTADRSDAAFVAAMRLAHPERERPGFARRPYIAKPEVTETDFGNLAPKPPVAKAPEPSKPAALPVPAPAAKAPPAYDRGACVRRIIAVVAAHYGLTPAAITGSGKPREVVVARWVAAELILTELGLSTVQVGRYLKRNFSTIFHGRRRHRARLAADAAYAAEVAEIRSTVRAALGRPA